MWVCTNVGFISIVVDNSAPEHLLKVRARNREHLETLFPARMIYDSLHTDYRYRVFATRDEVAHVVASAIMNVEGAPGRVNYPNFKDSVADHALHDLYAGFWSLHWRYQRTIEVAKERTKLAAREAAETARAVFTGKKRPKEAVFADISGFKERGTRSKGKPTR